MPPCRNHPFRPSVGADKRLCTECLAADIMRRVIEKAREREASYAESR